jgi:hypothetical protein
MNYCKQLRIKGEVVEERVCDVQRVPAAVVNFDVVVFRGMLIEVDDVFIVDDVGRVCATVVLAFVRRVVINGAKVVLTAVDLAAVVEVALLLAWVVAGPVTEVVAGVVAGVVAVVFARVVTGSELDRRSQPPAPATKLVSSESCWASSIVQYVRPFAPV